MDEEVERSKDAGGKTSVTGSADGGWSWMDGGVSDHGQRGLAPFQRAAEPGTVESWSLKLKLRTSGRRVNASKQKKKTQN